MLAMAPALALDRLRLVGERANLGALLLTENGGRDGRTLQGGSGDDGVTVDQKHWFELDFGAILF